MQANSTYVRELYAITEAVKKWRQYLLGPRFRIFTDQHSVKHLLTQVIQTPEQHKWVTKLLGYDFELHYKPRTENRVADALSRVEFHSMLALSASTTTWLNDLRDYYKTADGKTFIDHLRKQPNNLSNYTFRDNMVHAHGRLFIPTTHFSSQTKPPA